MNPGTTGTDRTAARAGTSLQEYYYELADHMAGQLKGNEVFTSQFEAEDSDFVRVNKASVRQAGSVVQKDVGIDLMDGARHANGGITLSGDSAADRASIDALIASLREKLPHLPEDPHLLYATEIRSSEQHGTNELPDAPETMASVLDQAKDLDFVGLWASGGIYRGFANSLGQRNWFSSYTFNLDWSVYHQADKAVKCGYAGFRWDPEEFASKLGSAREQLAILAGPAATIEPGRYRVYLAPSALADFVGTICWGGFGLKAHRTKQTSLIKMVEDGRTLNPLVTLLENTKEGVAPNFQSKGFLRPDQVVLLDSGAYKDCLVSPRSAKEFGVETNGAVEWEIPESIDMAAGGMEQGKILEELGTGLYVNNLHYLNYSDVPACRITGMTRFACFWVENGAIKAPLNVMRFDETAYRVLGENLLGLTREREMILAPDTYFGRSTDSMRLPGALVKDFSFTL